MPEEEELVDGLPIPRWLKNEPPLDALVEALEDTSALASRRWLSAHLLRVYPVRGVEALLALFGPTPEADGYSGMLLHALKSSGDPRAQGPLIELLLAGQGGVGDLSEAGAGLFVERVDALPADRRALWLHRLSVDGRVELRPSLVSALSATRDRTPYFEALRSVLVHPARAAILDEVGDASLRYRVLLESDRRRALRASRKQSGVHLARPLIEHALRPVAGGRTAALAKAIAAQPEAAVEEALRDIGDALLDDARLGQAALRDGLSQLPEALQRRLQRL